MFILNVKEASLNFFSVEILSLRVVVTIGRNDSKFVLLGGILSARLEPTFIKKIIERLSVISLLINKSVKSIKSIKSKLFGNLSVNILDFPITAFMKFQVFLILFP